MDDAAWIGVLARMEVTMTLYSLQSEVTYSNLVLEDFGIKRICVHNVRIRRISPTASKTPVTPSGTHIHTYARTQSNFIAPPRVHHHRFRSKKELDPMTATL